MKQDRIRFTRLRDQDEKQDKKLEAIGWDSDMLWQKSEKNPDALATKSLLTTGFKDKINYVLQDYDQE